MKNTILKIHRTYLLFKTRAFTKILTLFKPMTVDSFVLGFNKTLLSLLNFLDKKFPNDPDIISTRNKLNVAIQFTPREPAIQFMDGVVPFTKKIETRDETFFLNLIESKEYAKMMEGLNMKEKWMTFSDHQKDQVWQCFQKMVQLGDRIMMSS